MAGAAAQARSHLSRLRFLAALAAALAPQAAHAGAWIAPAEGQLILTEALGQHEEFGWYNESQVFVEAPLNERAAFVTRSWMKLRLEETSVVQRSETFAGGKFVVSRTDWTIAALQAGALWYDDPDPLCAQTGAELRGLVGASSSSGRYFANAEIAHQALGGCTRAKLDLTLGVRPGERWLAMAEAFLDDTDSPGKAQLSLTRFFEDGVGVQIGLRTELDGGEDDGPTFLIAFWREGLR